MSPLLGRRSPIFFEFARHDRPAGFFIWS